MGWERRPLLAVFIVACGNGNDRADAGQDAAADVSAVVDSGKETSPAGDGGTDAADANDATDDVAPIACTLTLSGAVTGTMDCIAHGAPFPTNMEQLTVHALPTSTMPYDVSFTCNEYLPIQTTTYSKPWSPVNDDGCYAEVIEQLADGGAGTTWFVGPLGSDAGSVSMTLTYFHQTQSIYMTIDGNAKSEAPLLDDASAPSVVNIQATF